MKMAICLPPLFLHLLLILIPWGKTDGAQETEGPPEIRLDTGQQPEGDAPRTATLLRDLVGKNTDFGFKLFRRITSRHDGNVVFSPISTMYATMALMLSMRSPNSQPWGDAEPSLPLRLLGQLGDILLGNRNLSLDRGSFAFVDRHLEIEENFLNLSRSYLNMTYVPVDFSEMVEARTVINRHIEEETQGKIPLLLQDIEPDVRAILADYIFFKGKWLHPFDPSDTRLETFHPSRYSTVLVPTMSQVNHFTTTYDQDLGCTVLRLPFRGKASMLVIITDIPGEHLSIEDYFTVELLDTWLSRMEVRQMEVFLPKFKLDQQYKMHQLLKRMGIKSIFSQGADLSGFAAPKEAFKISKIVQRAAIEVDEMGATAAVAMASEITAYAMPPVLRVDRPFHFMIYEDVSRALLFMGRVVDPS
ncbi:protein Z-dependent protease inhibitor isoform X1 [Tachyglossus aculeatus]|nr:protein Z-dependent protease inhibitor isoform X1 [Tachyglossus aculeatus]